MKRVILNIPHRLYSDGWGAIMLNGTSLYQDISKNNFDFSKNNIDNSELMVKNTLKDPKSALFAKADFIQDCKVNYIQYFITFITIIIFVV